MKYKTQRSNKGVAAAIWLEEPYYRYLQMLAEQSDQSFSSLAYKALIKMYPYLRKEEKPNE